VSLPASSLPVYKYLLYSDYIGAGEYDSKLLKTWIDKVQLEQKITIPGDGLEEISLLGEGDLSHLLVGHTLLPSSGNGLKIHLGNPEGISLLNLAYTFRTSLPFKVSLAFAPEQGSEAPIFDGDIYQSALSQIDYQLVGQVEDNLHKYLQTHIKAAPPTQPAVAKVVRSDPKVASVVPELPPLKKLTPLVKKAGPVFVPLESRRPKLSFPLPRPRRPKPLTLRPKTIVGRGLIIALALYLGTLAFTGTVAALSLRRIYSALQNNERHSVARLINFPSLISKPIG
jgi:hypothetical protein